MLINIFNVKKDKHDFKKIFKDKINLFNFFHLLATGFGIGLFPIISSTAVSLLSIFLWLFLLLYCKYNILILFFMICFGIYCCNKTSSDLGIHDHVCIVFDEFIGMCVTLITLSSDNYYCIFASFLLFMILDLLKPWPINWFDSSVCGGFGIVLDDCVAGLFAGLILHFLCRIIHV